MSIRRSARISLGAVLSVLFTVPARAQDKSQGAEDAALRNIKEIVARKAVPSRLEELTRHIQDGPTWQVQHEAIQAIVTSGGHRGLAALVSLAACADTPPRARSLIVRGLKPSASLLAAADIEKLLRSDPDGDVIYRSVLSDLASQANLQVSEVRAILERYQDTSHPVSFILFAGGQLKSREGVEFRKETAPIIEQFLIDCAHRARSEPANLRGAIAKAMGENGMPGTVEVLIAVLADYLDSARQGRPIGWAQNEIKELQRLTGHSIGYDLKAKPADPKNLQAMEAWLSWWEQNKGNPRYRLPEVSQ